MNLRGTLDSFRAECLGTVCFRVETILSATVTAMYVASYIIKFNYINLY